MGSKNFKALVHLLNTAVFLWTQVAYAAAAYDPIVTYKGMVQSAQAKRPKAVLQELFEQNKKDFPYEFRRELEFRMKKFNPALPAPELDVVNEGKNKIVRIHFRHGKNNTTVQITNRHDVFAEVIGSWEGKSFRHKISADEIGDPLALLRKMTGKRRTITRAAPSVQLLKARDLALLGETEKKAYIDRVRDIMEAAEKAQNAFRSAGVPAKTVWNPFFENAFAAGGPEGDCIIAGWGGKYRNGSCAYPDGETKDSGGASCMQCNPAIYAEACIPFNGKKVSITATADCNRATEKDKYKPFYGIKNQADFDAKMGDLKGTIDELQTKCAGIKTNEPPKLKDQAPTCAAFEGRLTDLSNATCQLLEKDKTKFPDLQCVAKEKIDDIPEEEAEEPQDLPDCGNQPKRVNCGTGTKQTMQCKLKSGKVDTREYCECAPGEERMNNTLYPTSCAAAPRYEEPRERRRDFDDDREYRRKRPKPVKEESGFLGLGWQNWLAIALVVGVGYYAFTQIPKATPWQTPNPQWPNPPVMWQATPTTGTGTTYPINSTR